MSAVNYLINCQNNKSLVGDLGCADCKSDFAILHSIARNSSGESIRMSTYWGVNLDCFSR